MKQCINRLSLVLVLYLCVFVAKAQPNKIQKIAEVTIDNEIVQCTVDIQKNVYVADVEGNIYKYTPEGKLLNKYSPDKLAAVTALSTLQSIRVFAFSADLQEYVVLDRFLALSKKVSLGNTLGREIGFASVATISSDQKIWVFDTEDYSLKKVDPILAKTIITTPCERLIDEESQILQIKEHHNKLYLVTSKEIYIFDTLGNYKKTLNIQKISNIFFYDAWVACINQENNLYLYNLYIQEIILIHSPINNNYHLITFSKDYFTSVIKNKIYFYKLIL